MTQDPRDLQAILSNNVPATVATEPSNTQIMALLQQLLQRQTGVATGVVASSAATTTPTSVPIVPADPDKGPYDMTDVHNEDWTRVGNFNADTAIARAWTRLHDKGIDLGSPVSEEYTDSAGFVRQVYQFAKAKFDASRNNINQVVEFSDARGIVGHESGL